MHGFQYRHDMEYDIGCQKIFGVCGGRTTDLRRLFFGEISEKKDRIQKIKQGPKR